MSKADIGHVVGQGGKCWCGKKHEDYIAQNRKVNMKTAGKVSIEDIKYLRAAYARELKREKQASEGTKQLWRNTIALFDEVLESRRKLVTYAPNEEA
jgi:hypothetical protein